MNSWLIITILTATIIVISCNSKIDNPISTAYSKYLIGSVEKCKIINKLPWFTTTKLSDDMCKGLIYSNEYLWDADLTKPNYESDELDYDNLEQQQQELSKKIMNDKRGMVGAAMGCDCQIKNDLIDLGYPHFPRYLFNAVCQDNSVNNGNSKITLDKKSHVRRCWRGSQCKPVEYKVLVLTHRTTEDLNSINDHSSSLLPDVLRPDWKFKTVTVAAGCSCSF